MGSTSTSESTCAPRSKAFLFEAGFTLVELLVGLALSVALGMAVAPLWLSLEGSGTKTADRTVWVVQERVAVARLERDLRLAGAEDCAFSITGPVVEASTSQVVFLTRSCAEAELAVVEWEIAGGSLMRRWGTCPGMRPVSYQNSLYVDHKTMLHSLGSHSAFTYEAKGRQIDAPVGENDLAVIDTVVLHLEPEPLSSAGGGLAHTLTFTTNARVGW